MNKTIGLILVTVGLGLTAGFGAYLSPAYRDALLQEGQATLSDAAVDEAFDSYCAARAAGSLDPAEGCGDSDPLVAPADAKRLSKTALRSAQLIAIGRGLDGVPDEVSLARTSYGKALQTSLQIWTTVGAAATRGPGERLSGWLDVGGGGFGFGFLLLVLGSWMCRKADASEADAGDGLESDAVDFGVLLSSVRDDVASLAADMEAMEAPTVGALDDFKSRLEDVQKEEMARLCASGPEVQRRHGLQGMAMLFSPLSSAERKMNRSWAALVDRHWPESLASVRGALLDLESAQSELSELQRAGD